MHEHFQPVRGASGFCTIGLNRGCDFAGSWVGDAPFDGISLARPSPAWVVPTTDLLARALRDGNISLPDSLMLPLPTLVMAAGLFLLIRPRSASAAPLEDPAGA